MKRFLLCLVLMLALTVTRCFDNGNNDDNDRTDTVNYYLDYTITKDSDGVTVLAKGSFKSGLSGSVYESIPTAIVTSAAKAKGAAPADGINCTASASPVLYSDFPGSIDGVKIHLNDTIESAYGQDNETYIKVYVDSREYRETQGTGDYFLITLTKIGAIGEAVTGTYKVTLAEYLGEDPDTEEPVFGTETFTATGSFQFKRITGI